MVECYYGNCSLKHEIMLGKIQLLLYTWKKVREHLPCYEGKLSTKFFQ